MGDAMLDNAAIARAMYTAFWSRRRDDAERLLADEFTFTSPYDDAIDRAEFFRRCWPNAELLSSFDIERVAADAEGAFITYRIMTKQGVQFRNTEYLAISQGRIRKADVYFGASYRNGRFVAKAPQ